MVRLEPSKERKLFDEYLQKNKEFEEFAAKFGVSNLYKDSNLQQLQQALYLGLTFQPSRQSVDAIDYSGHGWELKSLNIHNKKHAFSTANPLTRNVLGRYRRCRFAFSVYDDTDLEAIYVLAPDLLEPYFYAWETRLLKETALNNPQIPLRFVVDNGCLVYDASQSPYVSDPVAVLNAAKKSEDAFDESRS